VRAPAARSSSTVGQATNAQRNQAVDFTDSDKLACCGSSSFESVHQRESGRLRLIAPPYPPRIPTHGTPRSAAGSPGNSVRAFG